MSSLIFLIPIALAMGLAGLAIFFWAMRNEQFDDLDGAANRILIDEEDLRPVKADHAEAGQRAQMAESQLNEEDEP